MVLKEEITKRINTFLNCEYEIIVNILHVITTIEVGGAENQLLLVASEQARRGNSVSVVYLKGNPSLQNQFKARSIEVSEILANKSIVKQIVLLRIFVGKIKPEILHCHLPRAEIVGMLAVFPKKFIVSRHNMERFLPGGQKIVSRLLSRLVTVRAFKVIAITKVVRNFLINTREISDESKVVVVPYGLDRKRNKANNPIQVELLKTSIKFGTISRLVPQKNLECLLKGFELFSKRYLGHRMYIAGVGTLESNLKELASKMECSGSIYWLGKVNSEQFFEQIDCFILSSRYEGFGLVLLEAIRANLPVICSKTEAASEILGEDYIGFFSVGNDLELSSLLDKARNDDFRREIVQVNQEVLTKYTIEKSVDLLSSVYSNFTS